MFLPMTLVNKVLFTIDEYIEKNKEGNFRKQHDETLYLDVLIARLFIKITSMDGSITEYVCVYGNNGNYLGQGEEISSDWEWLNTMLQPLPIVAENIGLLVTTKL